MAVPDEARSPAGEPATWRHGAVAVALVASGLFACQLLVGVNDEDGVRPPDEPVLTDAGSDADPCMKLHPPPKPSGASSGGEGTIFFALKTLRLRGRGAPPIGYDLDDRCTGDPTSTTSDPPCTNPSGTVVDDDGGLDNAFGRLLETVNAVFPPEQGDDLVGEAFSGLATRGIYAVIIQVSGWNGLPDDDDVRVGILTGTNYDQSTCTTTRPGLPEWNGCDKWSVAPDQGYDPALGVSLDTVPGYVANGVLVSKSTAPRSAGLGAAPLLLHGSTLTARIGREGDAGYLRDGIMAGRVDVDGLINFARHIDRDGKLLCNDATYVGLFTAQICPTRDITLSAETDRRDAVCNAVSFALGFDGVSSSVANVSARDAGQCPPQVPSDCE